MIWMKFIPALVLILTYFSLGKALALELPLQCQMVSGTRVYVGRDLVVSYSDEVYRGRAHPLPNHVPEELLLVHPYPEGIQPFVAIDGRVFLGHPLSEWGRQVGQCRTSRLSKGEFLAAGAESGHRGGYPARRDAGTSYRQPSVPSDVGNSEPPGTSKLTFQAIEAAAHHCSGYQNDQAMFECINGRIMAPEFARLQQCFEDERTSPYFDPKRVPLCYIKRRAPQSESKIIGAIQECRSRAATIGEEYKYAPLDCVIQADEQSDVAKALRDSCLAEERKKTDEPSLLSVARCQAKRAAGQDKAKEVARIEKCFELYGDSDDRRLLATCLVPTKEGTTADNLKKCLISDMNDGSNPTILGTIGCTGFKEFDLNPEQKIAADCIVNNGGEPVSSAQCTGRELLKRELTKCRTRGFGGDKGCYGKNNEWQKVASTLDKALKSKDNGEISKAWRKYARYKNFGPEHDSEAYRVLNKIKDKAEDLRKAREETPFTPEWNKKKAEEVPGQILNEGGKLLKKLQ